MENTNALPTENRRKAKEYMEFQDRRARIWRDAADRAEQRGESATALLFRNEAYFIEQDKKR